MTVANMKATLVKENVHKSSSWESSLNDETNATKSEGKNFNGECALTINNIGLHKKVVVMNLSRTKHVRESDFNT